MHSDGKIVGQIHTEFDDQDKENMKCVLELHFYDTMIKTVVYTGKYPNKKQIGYITNY